MLAAGSISHWFRYRDPSYIASRAAALARRYGLGPRVAQARILDGMALLARYGCAPTFPVPGRVVDAHGDFCRELQEMGAELAVHGYDHVDFRSLSLADAHAQFAAALAAFGEARLRISGFRCPYLSYSDSLSASLPPRAFQYSSNRAVWWNVLPPDMHEQGNAIFHALQSFYNADPAEDAVVTPTAANGVVEIPASIPDDLQLYDGLKLGADGLASAWLEILRRVNHRGELFALLFHPESFRQCGPAFEAVLSAALAFSPPVWIAQLRDVAEWWLEKQSFTAELEPYPGGFRIHLQCTPRATVLARNLFGVAESHPWYGSYTVLAARSFHLQTENKPYIGVELSAPQATVAFLRDQGYLVDHGPSARECSLYFDAQTLAGFRNARELIDFIELDSSPLLRFWRWPSEFRSALCVTGDLDALSLLDYLRRVLPFGRRVSARR